MPLYKNGIENQVVINTVFSCLKTQVHQHERIHIEIKKNVYKNNLDIRQKSSNAKNK